MRGLTLKQLEAVLAIARHRTVTAAAAAVRITPSAMTTRLIGTGSNETIKQGVMAGLGPA